MNQEVELNGTTPDKDARNWAMMSHLSALAGYFIPLGNILAPLVIWAVKKDESSFVEEQAKEAMNFQLTMTIAYLAACVLIFVVIGIFILIFLAIYALVMMIIAAIKTNDGENFRYPYTIRFIK